MEGQLAWQMGFCLPLEMRAGGTRLSHTHICHPEDQRVSRALLWVHAKPRPPGKPPRSWILIMTSCFRVLFPARHSGTHCKYQHSRDRSEKTAASSKPAWSTRAAVSNTNNKKLDLVVHTYTPALARQRTSGLLKAQGYTESISSPDQRTT